jgi:hypothetical protein
LSCIYRRKPIPDTLNKNANQSVRNPIYLVIARALNALRVAIERFMLLTTKLQKPTGVFWDLECYLVANAHVNVIYLAYTRKMFYDGHTVESLDGSGNLRDLLWVVILLYLGAPVVLRKVKGWVLSLAALEMPGVVS